MMKDFINGIIIGLALLGIFIISILGSIENDTIKILKKLEVIEKKLEINQDLL